MTRFPSSGPETTTGRSRSDYVYEAWRRGRLRSWLHADQKRVYDLYRAWEQCDPSTNAGAFPRVFVLDIGRRWGKTTLRFSTRVEDCIRNPGGSYRYVSAYQKDIEEIVDEVAHRLFDSCPREFRPTYRQSGKADGDSDPRRAGTGFYFPERDGKVSVLKLVGLDKNPDGLRGRASDGDDISEAAFVRHLRYSVKNVLYHQYQGRPNARMCLESSAPRVPGTDYDEIFVADAKARGAYVYRTIEDNPLLTSEEREEFIRAAGGRDHPDCQVELFNLRVRDASRVVVPEFLPDVHVAEVPVPAYADCYVALDPGMRDLCAILWAFWDFENARLVVQRDWAQRNASTSRVAEVIRATESELWTGLRAYRNGQYRDNPYLRVSDTDLRLIHDLWNEHGIAVSPVNKTTGAKTELREAAVHSLRGAIGRGQVVIDPACKTLIAHLTSAHWNDARTDYDRSEIFGHFDCLDALVYLWRSVMRNQSAQPPTHHGTSGDNLIPPYARPLDSAQALQRALARAGRAPAWKRTHTWKPRKGVA